MRRFLPPALLLCLALSACGKPDHGASNAADPCTSVKGAPPYETDAQAVQACRNNKNFSGQDVKRSNIQITNH
jgi:hypothetical protein